MRRSRSTRRRYCRLLLGNGTCQDQVSYKELRDGCPRPASPYPLLPACTGNVLSPGLPGSKPCSRFADLSSAGEGPDSSAKQLGCHSLLPTESRQVEEGHW